MLWAVLLVALTAVAVLLLRNAKLRRDLEYAHELADGRILIDLVDPDRADHANVLLDVDVLQATVLVRYGQSRPAPLETLPLKSGWMARIWFVPARHAGPVSGEERDPSMIAG